MLCYIYNKITPLFEDVCMYDSHIVILHCGRCSTQSRWIVQFDFASRFRKLCRDLPSYNLGTHLSSALLSNTRVALR